MVLDIAGPGRSATGGAEVNIGQVGPFKHLPKKLVPMRCEEVQVKDRGEGSFGYNVVDADGGAEAGASDGGGEAASPSEDFDEAEL